MVEINDYHIQSRASMSSVALVEAVHWDEHTGEHGLAAVEEQRALINGDTRGAEVRTRSHYSTYRQLQGDVSSDSATFDELTRRTGRSAGHCAGAGSGLAGGAGRAGGAGGASRTGRDSCGRRHGQRLSCTRS